MSRPEHVPTDKLTAQVEALAGFGIVHDEIAQFIGVSPPTLRKHYRDALDLGVVKANAAVARALHHAATTGSVAAAIYWTKARMGWRDRDARGSDEERDVPLGKKEQANRDAESAQQGTEWESLLRTPRRIQ